MGGGGWGRGGGGLCSLHQVRFFAKKKFFIGASCLSQKFLTEKSRETINAINSIRVYVRVGEQAKAKESSTLASFYCSFTDQARCRAHSNCPRASSTDACLEHHPDRSSGFAERTTARQYRTCQQHEQSKSYMRQVPLHKRKGFKKVPRTSARTFKRSLCAHNIHGRWQGGRQASFQVLRAKRSVESKRAHPVPIGLAPPRPTPRLACQQMQ